MNAVSKVTIRSNADILELVPALLGFHPERSLVALSIGSGPHARVDLPSNEKDEREVFSTLTNAWVSNNVAQVILVTYDAADLPGCLIHRAAEAYTEAGVQVVATVSLDDGYFFEKDDTLQRYERALGDLQGVALSKRVETNRDALVARFTKHGDFVPLPETFDGTAEEMVRFCTSQSSMGAAQFVRNLSDPHLRDAVTMHGVNSTKNQHLTDLLITISQSVAPGSDGLLMSVIATLAYLDGNGALAWCAIEHAKGQGAAPMLETCLQGAVDPKVVRKYLTDMKSPA